MKKLFIPILFLLFINFVSAASFSVNPVFIKIIGQQNHQLEQQITIISNEDNQDFFLETDSDFFSLSETEISLDKSQDASARLIFSDLQQGVYYGKIKITGNEEFELPVVVGIESTSPEFGVSTQQFDTDLFAGQTLKLETDFVRLRGQGSGAIVNYSLQDINGRVIYSESELINIASSGQHIKTTKSFVVPEAEGQYIFSVIVSDLSGRTVSISPSVFSVVKEKFEGSRYAMILAIVVLIMTIIFVAFNYAWSRTLNQSTDYWKSEIKSLKHEKFSDNARQLRKIESKLYLLEQAYERGYIKKRSYSEARRALSLLASRLKKRL